MSKRHLVTDRQRIQAEFAQLSAGLYGKMANAHSQNIIQMI
jgi:hypothetical protein